MLRDYSTDLKNILQLYKLTVSKLWKSDKKVRLNKTDCEKEKLELVAI